MKIHIAIFYTITSLLLILVNILQASFILPYLEVFYVVFTFAESYYVLQNYDFDHGIPFIATFIKLVNTMTVLVFPLVALVIHLIIHIYIYSHIRGLDSRETRLKYAYTVNNVIPGPLVLKIFASFLTPTLFLMLVIIADLRIHQKLKQVGRLDIIKPIVVSDFFVLVIIVTQTNAVAFLIYMIGLILFEFIPIENKYEQ